MRRVFVLLCAVALLLTCGGAARAAPVPATSTVYSVDVAAGTLVNVPTTGGAPRILFRGGDIQGLAADSAGNAYFVDASARAVLRVTAGTGAVTTIASDLGTTRDVAVDDAGNVYFVDGRIAYKVSPTGQKTTVYTAPGEIYDVAVTPAGQLTLATGALSYTGYTLVTIRPGGTASSRVLDCSRFGYCADVKADSRGSLWVLIRSSGASGYSEWYRVAAEALVPTDVINARTGYYGVGIDSAATFYVAATKTFCTVPGQNTGRCTPDLRSSDIGRFDANGRFSGMLTLSGLTLSSQGSEIGVDNTGDIYINANNGLLKYAKTGGAPTMLAAGSYKQVVVVG